MKSEFNKQLSTEEAKCCGCCKHFQIDGVYGVGCCEMNPKEYTYCDCVCDDFESTSDHIA